MKPMPWLVCHDFTKGEDAYAMECLRCGMKQRVATPISIDMYSAMEKIFRRQHAKCKPKRKKEPKP